MNHKRTSMEIHQERKHVVIDEYDDDDDDASSFDSSDDEAIIKRMKLAAMKKNKKKTKPSFVNQKNTSMGILTGNLIRQERKHLQFIEDNEEMVTSSAMRLDRNDRLKNLLGEEITEEYRQNLKKIANDNITNKRQLSAYMNTMKAVTNTITNSKINSNEHQDLEQQMKVIYANELKTIVNDSVMVTQDPGSIKRCQLLEKEEKQDEKLTVNNTNSNDNN